MYKCKEFIAGLCFCIANGVNKDLPSFIKDAFETHRQGKTGFLTHSAYSGRKIDNLEQPFIRNTVANYEDTMLLQEIARNNLNST